MSNASSTASLLRARRRLETVQREAWLKEQAAQNKLNTNSCSICTVLHRMITVSTASRAETVLGTLTDVLGSACQYHVPLFVANDALLQQDIVLRKPANRRLIYVHPDPYRNQDAASLEAPWEVFDPHQVLPLLSASPEEISPRIVDQNWIEVNLIKGWLNECESHHQSTCGSTDRDSTLLSHPLLLIDTHQNCLVHQTIQCRYVALSYVWGNANIFLTTMATKDLLYKPDALTNTNLLGVQLPQTIEQAIKLTKALGERYLWVDALCIIQDGADQADQLNAMASIYTHACLTIAAAQGQDANSGFHGLKGISEKRHIGQRIAPILPDRQLLRPSSRHVWDDSLLQTWSTRAWTFQEALCSRRLLFFAHDTVRWRCAKAWWSEESTSSDCLFSYATAEQQRFSLESPTLSSSTLPMLHEYEALVNAFNLRSLTHPEDALFAFAGISTRLSKQFKGGLISGLPEVFFDICLLWRPLRRLDSMPRRLSKTLSTINNLPSWSWAGWETEVSFPYTWNVNKDPAGPAPVLLGSAHPFGQAIIHYTDQNGTKVLVNNSWSDYAIASLDKHMPQGWSSRKASGSEYPDFRQAQMLHLFRHESDRSSEFCFPVPLSDSTKAPRTAELLHIKTSSGKFKLGERKGIMTRIRTIDRKPAGTLWQHDEVDEDYVTATSGPSSSRPSIELIAILGCTISIDDDVLWEPLGRSSQGYDVNGQTEPSRLRDVYNVMWIQRHEDIARRKATGQIDRLVWETYARNTVDVTLG